MHKPTFFALLLPAPPRRGLEMRRRPHILAMLICALIGLHAFLPASPAYSQQTQPANFQKHGAAHVSLEHMVGQMIMIGFSGVHNRQAGPKTIAYGLQSGAIGGVIFMQRNIRSLENVQSLTEYFKRSSPASLPLISVDQEGGYVQRLKKQNGFRNYPSAQRIAATMSAEKAFGIYQSMARELKEAGFNLNFGPVLDLNTNRKNPVISRLRRSYGQDAEKVIRYGESFIAAHRSNEILTAVKHFPGHGSSWADSHKKFVDLTRTWRPQELSPYQTLIKHNQVDMVMIGHLYHPDFSDGNKLPATLSARAVNDILRNRLGYNGVVITDDMEMAAVRKHYTLKHSIIRAVQAGNDILLFSGDRFAKPDSINRIRNIILAAINRGQISPQRIAQSYRRIIALKHKLAARQAAPAAPLNSSRDSSLAPGLPPGLAPGPTPGPTPEPAATSRPLPPIFSPQGIARQDLAPLSPPARRGERVETQRADEIIPR